MIIRPSIESDLQAVLQVEEQAFGAEEGPVIVKLIQDLLQDPTATPLLSLIAEQDGQLIGHVMFTSVNISNANKPVSASILAPLAVGPDQQNRGVGGRLIREGLKRLKDSGVQLVFVLGYPGYYSRHGFIPASEKGFTAPHPVPQEHADAWMVQELVPGIIESVSGDVSCSITLNRPEYW